MKIPVNNIVRVLLVLGALPVFFGTKAYFSAVSQAKTQDEKVIARTKEPNEPLEIVSIAAASTPVEIGRAFEANGDWLRNFSVTYRNKSRKSIVSATFYITFPETSQTGSMMMYPVLFGPPKGEESKVAPVAPSESMSIGLSDVDLEKLKKFIGKRHSLETLSKADIGAGFILFSDGTAWAHGSYRRRDPMRPEIWIDDPTAAEVSK